MFVVKTQFLDHVMSIKKIIFEKMMSKKCINLIIIIIVLINKLRNNFNQIDIFVVAWDTRNFGFVHISYRRI